MEVLEVWTDGSASPNPGYGGWGWLIKHPERTYQGWGGEEYTTNNRMEMMGAIQALDFIHEHGLIGSSDLATVTIKITTDSNYLMKGFNQWSLKWKQFGWKKTLNASEDVMNKDLWVILDKYRDFYKIEFFWVKGHAGTVENEMCDQLATRGTREARRGRK